MSTAQYHPQIECLHVFLFSVVTAILIVAGSGCMLCVLINFHNCIDGGKRAFEERKVRKGEQETCGNHIKHAVIVNVFPTSWMIRKGIDTAHQHYSHYKNN